MECSVIGVPDALRGQAIKAIVVLSCGYKESKELELEIKEFCNQKLAEYKWIRIIEFADEMPKTISGKIQKSVQRKQSQAVNTMKLVYVAHYYMRCYNFIKIMIMELNKDYYEKCVN